LRAHYAHLRGRGSGVGARAQCAAMRSHGPTMEWSHATRKSRGGATMEWSHGQGVKQLRIMCTLPGVASAKNQKAGPIRPDPLVQHIVNNMLHACYMACYMSDYMMHYT